MSDRDHAEAPWRPEMLALADRLTEMGYDIEPPPPGESPVASIVARRDLEDRTVVLAVDASGRFRAAITWLVGEWPSREEIAGVAVQVVDAVSRSVTVTGQVADPRQVAELVAGLGTIAPWASVAGETLPPPSDDGDRRH
jgi:hypothetical protein